MDDSDVAPWSDALGQRYSAEEVYVAREYAKQYALCIGHAYATDLGSTQTAWEMFYTLTSDDAWGTSDDAWGCGRVYVVEMDLVSDVRGFMVYMMETKLVELGLISSEYSVVAFMQATLHRIDDPGFVRMLRMCLYAYQDTLDILSPVGDAEDGYAPFNDAVEDDYYTALILAASCNIIPLCVTETLLQAGARVDQTQYDGNTPLLIAIQFDWGFFPKKVDMLLDYGADIDAFNRSFKNPLHLAVSVGNVRGLRTILGVRLARLATAPQQTLLERYWTRLRKTGPGACREMIHMHDVNQDIPLTIAAGDTLTSYTARLDMIQQLVDAGTDAEWDLDRDARPPRETFGHGVIHYLPREDLVVVNVCKGVYTARILVDLDDMVESVKKDESVLPGGAALASSRTKRECFYQEVFKSCQPQGFYFVDNGVASIDFDLHLAVCSDKRASSWEEYDAQNVSPFDVVDAGDARAEHKLAIRCPRGPCPDDGEIPVKTIITVHPQYNLAHRAATCRDADARRLLFFAARPLCNPLRKCDGGFTAVELLGQHMTGVVVDWSTKRLIKNLRKEHDDMLAYIHKDALRLGGTTTRKETALLRHKRPRFTSRFHHLSDDVCRIIISFI